MPMRSSWTRSLFLLATLAVLTMQVPASGRTREPILAGSWYPSDPDRLRADVTAYLDGGGPVVPEISALIVPHAGYRFSGATAGRGYATVRGRSFRRVVLLGPSHRVAFKGAALTDHDAWRTPLGEVPIDREAIEKLEGQPGFRIFPDAHAREHSLEIEIPFLQVALQPGFRVVPIVLGQLDDALAGQIAAGLETIVDDRTLLVTSSDFTHYGPDYGYIPFRVAVPEGIRRLDDGAIQAIETLSAGEFQRYRRETEITVCGREPIRVLLTLLDGKGGKFERLGYARSGDIMDDFTNSVSYVAMAYSPAETSSGGSPSERHRSLNEKEQSFLLKLARETILARLQGQPLPTTAVADRFPEDSPLHEVRGLFVTLNERDRLRGCMGNIVGSKKLVEGVAEQALISAFEDPRFPPVQLDEMDRIEIEISVLTPLESVSGPEQIEVGRHGVLLEKRGRRAVFLPQVAPEQGWDREMMLSRLCQKAGLGPDEWRSGASFQVFEAQVFGEEPRGR